MDTTLEILEGDIKAMLHGFDVQYKKIVLVNGVSFQFIIPQFGLIVSGINRMDYTIVHEAVNKNYSDWRQVYITTFDKITDMKYEVLWELMKGGYLTWLRREYPRSFKRLITESLGDRIIKQRLKLFGDKPKYAYLRSLNEWAKDMTKTYVLSIDSGFFDYMIDEK